MYDRRKILAASGTALSAATLPGCGFLNRGGGGESGPGEWWFTGGVFTAPRPGSDGQPGPRIETAQATDPARVHRTEGFPADLVDSFPLLFDPAISGVQLPRERVEDFFAASRPPLRGALGDFDVADLESQLPDSATSRGSRRGVSRFTWPGERVEGARVGLAFDSDRIVSSGLMASTDDALSTVDALVDASMGSGESVADGAPISTLTSYLEDGFYRSYRDLGTETPAGLSIRVADGQAHRRSMIVYPSEDAAGESFLLDSETEESIRRRHIPGRELEPYDELTISRDGRTVTTTATLPLERLYGLELLFYRTSFG